ncbi:MAG: hypothetical protein ACE15C_16705 [Phycisphaerae bacterium]
MKDHPVSRAHRHPCSAAFVAAVVCALAAMPATGQDAAPQEGATVTGKMIRAFDEGGENVLVVQGGFKMELGKRVLSGQEAVLWIRDQKAGQGTRHDITVYIKGDAKVVEAAGTTTGDKTMLVSVQFQGRLFTEGAMTRQAMQKDPLYVEAAEVRKKSESAASGPAIALAPAPTIAPTPSPTAAPAPKPWPSATGEAPRPAPTGAPKPASQPVAKFDETIGPKAVTARIDKFTLEENPPGSGKYLIICRNGIVLSQGVVDSDLYLELRSRNAVIFLEPAPKPTTAPSSQPVRQGPVALGLPTIGTGGGAERLKAVYLEGDVVIARGDKYMRAPRAYYDFVDKKAVVLDPVFRMVQAPRHIPIYVRAQEARILSESETWFKDAKATTSDFYTPSYAMGASDLYLLDKTKYDETGVRISERQYKAKLWNETAQIGGVPVAWWPYSEGDFEEGHSPLRRVSVGKEGDLGIGVQTEWDLFRLLGMVPPDGTKGRVDFDVYSKGGVLGGVNLKYARRVDNRQYSGYANLYGLLNGPDTDSFGGLRDDIPAPSERSWVQWRHKEILPRDLEMQFEFAYMSDQNFLERYFPNEFYSGKEQETLFYAKKQRDDWAFTTLLQYRINDFLTQTDSLPDLALYLLGEPLAGDRLSFFSENRLGLKRFRAGENEAENPGGAITGIDKTGGFESSDFLGRGDTRQELDLPLHAGPLNLVPFIVGRFTGWTDSPNGQQYRAQQRAEALAQSGNPNLTAFNNPFGPHDNLHPDGTPGWNGSGGGLGRAWGQTGIKANTSIWRVYNDVENRLWDLHKIKHVMTPEIVAFGSLDNDVQPDDLFPMDPNVESRVGKTSGVVAALYQRLVTKRGPAGSERDVDWMKLDVSLGFYDTNLLKPPADGRFDFSRPEFSIPRNHLNFDYTWNISDATSFLGYLNWDLPTNEIGLADAGFSLSRDPRLRYYIGYRYIRDLAAEVGTFGINYKINRKYSISLFEQYDFKFNNGENLASSLSVIRKFERWYAAITLSFDQRNNQAFLYVTIWPEGIPEIKIGGERLSLFGGSSNN